MSKIVRAFLISAAATGAAAFIVTQLQQKETNKRKDISSGQSSEVEADALSEHQVKALTDELGTML